EEVHQLHGQPGGSCDRDRRVVVGGEHLAHLVVGDRVAGRGAPVAGHDDAVGVLQAQDRGPSRHLDPSFDRRSAGERGRERLGRLPADQIHEARVRAERRSRDGQGWTLGHSPPFWTYDLTNSSASSAWAGTPSTWVLVPRRGWRMGRRCKASWPVSTMSESHDAAAIASGYFPMHRPRKYARVSSGGSMMAISTSSSVVSRSTFPDASSRWYKPRSRRTSWYWRSTARSLGWDHSRPSRWR